MSDLSKLTPMATVEQLREIRRLGYDVRDRRTELTAEQAEQVIASETEWARRESNIEAVRRTFRAEKLQREHEQRIAGGRR